MSFAILPVEKTSRGLAVCLSIRLAITGPRFCSFTLFLSLHCEPTYTMAQMREETWRVSNTRRYVKYRTLHVLAREASQGAVRYSLVFEEVLFEETVFGPTRNIFEYEDHGSSTHVTFTSGSCAELLKILFFYFQFVSYSLNEFIISGGPDIFSLFYMTLFTLNRQHFVAKS